MARNQDSLTVISVSGHCVRTKFMGRGGFGAFLLEGCKFESPFSRKSFAHKSALLNFLQVGRYRIVSDIV